jgi:DNA-binding CsgD family transcriptional regulator/tetratricopeptide (TPR) repeat protein
LKSGKIEHYVVRVHVVREVAMYARRMGLVDTSTYPLVEREHALAIVAGRLADAATRAGSICLVSGQAGIGKTALLRHVASSHAASARWLWGSCDPLSTPRALGPLHDVARWIGGVLAERLSNGAPRELIFNGLLDALDDERRPTVLVFEDLHWADQATLDLVLFVGRRIAARPVVLLISFRDDEDASDPMFHATVGALPPDLVHHIPLEPLSPQGVAALAARAGAGRTAATLHEMTGGNPFFVTEMLAADDHGISPTLRGAVLARTRGLSPRARAALDLLAVLPQASDVDLLERQLGLDIAVLRELTQAGLLVADGGTIAFRHELARLAIESAIDDLQRRTLNARVLHALTDRRETSGDVPLARLVHHARAAYDGDAVGRFAPLAAREAARASAHREALSHYELALACSSASSDEQRAELLEAWSVEAYLFGHVTEAIEGRRKALAIWTTTGAHDRAGAALRWLSRLHWWAGNPSAAQQAGLDAVRILETETPGHELAMAYSNLAQLEMLAQRNEAAILWGERAIVLARSLADTEALAHALTNVGTAQLRKDAETGAAMLEEAFTMASDAHLDDHAQRALVNLATTYLELREYHRAEREFDRAMRYADAHDLHAYAHYLGGQRARLHLERGEWVFAERQARRVLAEHEYVGVTTIPAIVVLGTIQLRRGDAEAAETLAHARERAYGTRELQRIGPTAAALAEHAWLAGDFRTAVAEAEPALELARLANDPWRIGELAFRLHVSSRTADASGAAEPWRLMLAGDWRAAASEWERIGCPYERAEALALGDEPAMLAAIAAFDALGAVRRAGLVRRSLRERGRRVPAGPRRATRTNAAGLTPRQMEVLRVLAEGCTNQEIAERLFLAPKTVDHHVSAILGKLGAATRRDAAAAARRLALL